MSIPLTSLDVEKQLRLQQFDENLKIEAELQRIRNKKWQEILNLRDMFYNPFDVSERWTSPLRPKPGVRLKTIEEIESDIMNKNIEYFEKVMQTPL